MLRSLLAGAAVVVAVAAPAVAQDAVSQKGRHVVQWKDEKVQVVIGTRFASSRFPSTWLMIEAHVAAAGNPPIEIFREDVALVVPGGTRVQLASQKAMAEGIRDVRMWFQEAAIKRDPIEAYFVGPTRQERLAYFAAPTEQIVFDQVTVDRNTIASGFLFFRAPGDEFPPGRYVLEIFNKQVDVKLPFVLPAGASRPAGKDKDDKTVPW